MKCPENKKPGPLLKRPGFRRVLLNTFYRFSTLFGPLSGTHAGASWNLKPAFFESKKEYN
jgi:hypothetical protein